ncbi:replication initiator protein [Solihabitans fulvus]|uniref:Replication initiator protein n=1 Tax=Solihabitans fulvus TaxID=1892852 RepID=A0A5B2WMZ7_9PSEU|nr:replication initiator [Solihabitans fulvus]KAA2252150.1 replication initiator protein [Solihabitans fulvus]
MSEYLTRADRMKQPAALDVARAVAEEHGVCVRPLAKERVDLDTGRVDIMPIPCGSTVASVCPTCAEKNRRLRMAQCREGWHLTAEPDFTANSPSTDQRELTEYRADLVKAYREAVEEGDENGAEEVRTEVAEVDAELRQLGVRGSLPPLDPRPQAVRKRSTRRRQDTPNLPRRPVSKRTVGAVFGGKYRPSTFLTLTLDSYGKVLGDGTPADPDTYNYRRAARDAVHFAALLDRFVQNLRRCVGWEVQYFSTVEPQRRLAPHWHAAIRGSVSRAELRAVAEATYHQVWWPAHDEIKYSGDRLPVWDSRTKGFVDSETRQPLPTWEDALDQVDEPAHVARFGAQVHAKGILGGTEEAGRHVGYLTKYLTKSIGECYEASNQRQDDHAARLQAELTVTPCSPQCPVWLLYGVQPKGARLSMEPGKCKGKAHKRSTLGVAGRRVLVSRKWSGKSLADHRHDRKTFVRQLLAEVGITRDDTPTRVMWSNTTPGDPNVPPRQHLLLRAVAERRRWKAEYTAALLASAGPPGTSATDQAA